MATTIHRPIPAKSAPTFNDFDPNGANLTLWGVWDGREFYTRRNRGGCITRFGNSGRAKLYELTPQGWHLHATKDLEIKNDTCDLCGLVGVEDAHTQGLTSPYYTRRAVNKAWRWERKGGSITKPPKLWFLCPGCVMRTGW